MREVSKFMLLLLAFGLGCSPANKKGISGNAASSASAPKSSQGAPISVPRDVSVPREWTVSTNGEPFRLSIRSGVLNFCDKRGGRDFNLSSGQDKSSDHPCGKPQDDGNVACAGFLPEAEVDQVAPNDRVYVDGKYYPMTGLVHDCVSDGTKIAVITGSEIAIIDLAAKTKTVVGHDGGDLVALGSGWLAWRSSASLIRVVRL